MMEAKRQSGSSDSGECNLASTSASSFAWKSGKPS